MSKRETSKEIDDEAARWAARIDRGPLSAEEIALLDAWLSADARRLGAFARAQAVSVHSERAQALGPGFDPAGFSWRTRLPALTRRKAILLGTAAAAVAGTVILPRLLSRRGARTFLTNRGETRIVPLEDGSIVTLNTASKIAISYTDDRRNAHLFEGEALFDVAKDPARPFTASAGVTQVRAVGTSFAILVLPKAPVRVLVREGIVDLMRPGADTSPAIRLPANTRAIAPDDGPIDAMPISAEELNRELIWREGRIAFEGSSLKEAAETFGRYSDIRIMVPDPSVADRRITGLFVSNDPVGFAKAVAISLGLHVRVGDGAVELSR